jgi:hypothetical protein
MRRAWPPRRCCWSSPSRGSPSPTSTSRSRSTYRSALTHSALPLALAFWRFARPAAAGLAIGIGVHLAADLFPERMTDYALVKVPFGGALDSSASYLWLFANAALCTGLGALLLRPTVAHRRAQAVLLGATLLLAAWYLIVREGSLLALLLYALLAWLTLRRTGLGPA